MSQVKQSNLRDLAMSLSIDLRRPDAVHVFFTDGRVWWDGSFQIVEAGGDVNGEKDGITIMTRAANEGNAEAVRRLIRYGAHTQKASQAQDTPLMIAAEHGHVECVDALIRGGADINIPTTSRRRSQRSSWPSGCTPPIIARGLRKTQRI